MKGVTGFALLLCAASSQAIAQDAVQNGPDAGAARDSMSDTSNERGSGLGEIVVTANRRERRLQEVPISVTAVTSDQLSAAGLANPRRLGDIVPGLSVSQNAHTFSPVIRGVGSNIVGAGAEGGIAVYIDGVYIPNLGNTFQDLLEPERVEVLRGPQGSLFGRNATGGLINIITRDPSFDTQGHLQFRYGRFNSTNLNGYVTFGLSDTLAMDFAASYSESNGYVRDIVNGGTANPSRSYGFRAKLLFKPSEDFTIKASLTRDYSKDPTGLLFFALDRNASARAADPNVILPDESWEAAFDTRPKIFANTWRGDVQTSINLGGVTLETTSAYSDDKSGFISDIDRTALTTVSAESEARGKALSNEIRLFSTGRRTLEWIVGGYQFYNKATQPLFIHSGSLSGPVISMLDPLVRTYSLAGFGEVTLNLTDQLSLTAGARYTYEKIKFRQARNGATLVNTSTSNEKFTPKFVAQYKFDSKTNVYASYSVGFKSGAFAFSSTSDVPVEPETLKSYEFGIHSDPLPGLRVNASVFHYDYSNLQVTARAPIIGFTLQNAASAKADGGELEVTAEPVPGLVLRANTAYLDAKFEDYQSATSFTPILDPITGVPVGGNTQIEVDASGNRLPRSPKWTWGLGASYERDLGDGTVGGTVNLFHSSIIYSDAANDFPEPSYEKLSGELFWSPNPSMRFSIWGTNLTNAKISRATSFSASGNFRINEPPREYGVSARINF